MEQDDYIEQLEAELIEVKTQLKNSKDKEYIYLDILSNIDISINELFNRESENNRFNLGEDINFRECVLNLKKSLDEYKRIYKLRL